MSKRKNRSKAPNIPQETLERARRQAAGEDVDVPQGTEDEADAPAQADEPAPVKEEAASEPAAEAAASPDDADTSRRSQRRTRRSSRRSRSGAAVGSTPIRVRKKDVEDMTYDEITELLAHPTKTVSEEELHEQYGYVLKDLRNMGVLAAALFIALILIAQFL